jgi:hypothetical protein
MFWRAVLAAAPLTLGLTAVAVLEPATPATRPDSTAQAYVRRVAQAHDVGALFTLNGSKLGTHFCTSALVRVTGYPDSRAQPISCQSHTSAFSPGQMQFDCPDYTVGTSGSPFLVDVDPATGDGMVIGVLGGYELGGNTPDISYSAAFGQHVQALYQAAIAHG